MWSAKPLLEYNALIAPLLYENAQKKTKTKQKQKMRDKNAPLFFNQT